MNKLLAVRPLLRSMISSNGKRSIVIFYLCFDWEEYVFCWRFILRKNFVHYITNAKKFTVASPLHNDIRGRETGDPIEQDFVFLFCSRSIATHVS